MVEQEGNGPESCNPQVSAYSFATLEVYFWEILTWTKLPPNG